MKLEEFDRVEFNSSFRASAWEFKNLNLHRAVVELTGTGGAFAETDFDRLRQEITSHFQISKLRGFGFGIILNNFEVRNEQLPAWVDNSTKGGRACQWVVASFQSEKRISGCHMWQKGTTTDIFEAELRKGASEGLKVTKQVKPPEGLMKFATMVSPALRLSRYNPDE